MEDKHSINNRQNIDSILLHVFMQGHNYSYELGDILGIFFSRKQMIFEKEPYRHEAGFSVLSILCGAGDGLTAEALFFDNGKLISEYRMSRKEKDLPEDWNDKKAGKHLVKYSIFKAAGNYTGKKQPWGILTGIRPAKIAYELIEQGLEDSLIIEKLKKMYSIKEDKARLICNVSKIERNILTKTNPGSISIYIGIPFCPTRCLYCSFASNPLTKGCSQVEPYMEALFLEIEAVGNTVKDKGWEVQSIYIGGGTPTSISEEQLDRLLKKVTVSFAVPDNEKASQIKEFTLEAGRPDTITKEKLIIAEKYGVNRISINPQTMNEDILKNIGRAHTSEQTVDAFTLARGCGFRNINMDVIAGLPGESPEQFEYTMKKIRELGPDSLTVHTLAVKRASQLKDHLQEYSLTRPGDITAMLDTAALYAEKMGMHPYYLYRQKNMLENLENVGYSRPGCESIYNIQIMEEKQTILALGADGVTKLVYPRENRIERIFNVKNVDEYIRRIDEMIERKRTGVENL